MSTVLANKVVLNLTDIWYGTFISFFSRRHIKLNNRITNNFSKDTQAKYSGIESRKCTDNTPLNATLCSQFNTNTDGIGIEISL